MRPQWIGYASRCDPSTYECASHRYPAANLSEIRRCDLVFDSDAWKRRAAATLPDRFAEPLAVRGNIPVAVSIARDWSVDEAWHFIGSRRAGFSYSTELSPQVRRDRRRVV